MIKKIFLFVLCVTMLLPTVAIAKTTDTNIIVDTVVNLGLIEGDEEGLRLDDKVKRSEFATIITRMMGAYSNMYSNSATVFEDVTKDHWAYGYIGFAYDLGLVNGTSDDTFSPEKLITAPEAIKIMVCALGYKQVAEQNGGYPEGYMYIANRFSIPNGISTLMNEITRRDICILLYNSFDVPVMVSSKIKTDDSQTMLSEYMKIEVREGVIVGTYNNRNGYVLDKNQINVSGEVYNVSEAMALRADELLGDTVLCYIDNRHDEDTIYYLRSKGRTGNTIVIDSEDILDETTLHQFVYYNEKDREKKETLSDDLIVFYNGAAVNYDLLSDSLLKPATGVVKLKDTDSDGEYDMVLVSEYKNLVLKLADNEKLYDKYASTPLDMSDYNSIRVVKEGQSIDVSDFKSGDILSMMESLDKRDLAIEVSDSIVTGSIKSISDDGEYTIIDEKGGYNVFKVADNYLAALAENNSLAEKLQLGSMVYSFKIDALGKIADVELLEEGNNRKYGYLNKAVLEEGDEGGIIELLTAENRFVKFTLEDSVKFGRTSGGTYNISKFSAEKVIDQLTSNGVVKKQLVQYVANNKDNISEIYLRDDVNTDSEYFHRDFTQETMVYRENTLDQNYYIDQDTIVFNVRANGTYEPQMSAGKYNKYFSNGTTEVVDLYNAADGIPDVVVLSNTRVITYETYKDGYETIIDFVNSPVLFINKVNWTVNSDGDSVRELQGYQDGELVSVYVSNKLDSNSEDISLLKQGVAIQYETNTLERQRARTYDAPEEIIVFKVMYDFSAKDENGGILWEYDTVVNDNAEILTMWGKVTYSDDSLCRLDVSTLNAEENEYVAGIHGGTVVLEYESKHGFKPANVLQIVKGKNAFIRQRYLNTREIVLY